MTVEMSKLSPPERTRIYTFPGGETVKLENVTHFLARDSGSHRVGTADGLLHIIPAGWLHVEIDADGWTL
jgi:hypothetical protein